MEASYSSLSNNIHMTVNIDELPIESRRAIFGRLLMDRDVNPGFAKMSHEDRKSANAWFTKWCGWPALR